VNIRSLNTIQKPTTLDAFEYFYTPVLSALWLHGKGIRQDDAKGQDAVG